MYLGTLRTKEDVRRVQNAKKMWFASKGMLNFLFVCVKSIIFNINRKFNPDKDLINLIASYHPYGFEEINLEEIMMESEEIRRMAKKIIAKFDVDENKPPNGQYILWSLDALVKIIKFCRVFTVGRTLSTVGFLPTNFDRKISTSIADRMIYEEDNFMTPNEEIVFIADCYFNRICLCLNDAHRKYGAEAPTTNKLAQALRADRVASSLLVKLFILLDDANDLRRENKQTRVQQGYDAFEVLR